MGVGVGTRSRRGNKVQERNESSYEKKVLWVQLSTEQLFWVLFWAQGTHYEHSKGENG